ncbi:MULTISPECIES: S49 family peptidase [Telluria group]|uniref:S49 family peptidase n=1 Tax=Telluria group TaxID=2895353 RepID=UPI00089152A9|nr:MULTISPECIES: S49 family peptidase [unclassified Duganella]SDH05831.1 signal peptide peptidase SppA [Duganella sp. OV458]SDK20275.1 signal peptide peptidase SppA [Duganella sp. OV510]
MKFAFLAQRLFNTPLAITPRKAEVVMAALAERMGVSHIARSGAQMMDDDEYGYADPGQNPRSGYDTVAGVAVIPIQGTLVQKLGTLRPYSGMTGYDGIRQNVLTALADSSVKAIVLDIDSPGGEVAGCFDLVDTIYRARGTKPIWSILNESAYSAGYAIASAADKVLVPRTGGVGSVGVIWAHMDWSKALTEAGFKVTFITYGDLKAEGRPEIELSDEARARFQADINTMGELFVETVARNRNIPAAKVRDTQAGTFLGAAGVAQGLADSVMAPDAAFRALLAELD